MLVGRTLSDVKVEERADIRSFPVVVGFKIERLLRPPPVFYPGVKAGLDQRLNAIPGPLAVALDRRRRPLQNLLGRREASTNEHEIVIVGGRSLGDPQLAAIVLPRIVIGTEAFRPELFDVPCVEVFMRHQVQEASVGIGILENKGPGPKDSRINVLGSAARLRCAMNEKDVALIRIVSPEIPLCSDDLADVPDQRIGVPVSCAGDAEDMRNSVHMEGEILLGSDLDRTVDKIIVIRGGKNSPAAFQSRCDMPVLKWIDGDRDGKSPVFLDVHE